MSSFPNKEERTKCWSSRDAYWACLDEAETKGTKPEACRDLQKLYESSCPSQWVKHFDRKRTYEKFKTRMQREGYDPLKDGKK